MVDLVEDWEDLAECTRSLPKSIKAGSSYQLKKCKHGVEIKVRVCKYGYSKEFKDEDDVELIKIPAFCKVEESRKSREAPYGGKIFRKRK